MPVLRAAPGADRPVRAVRVVQAARAVRAAADAGEAELIEGVRVVRGTVLLTPFGVSGLSGGTVLLTP